MGLQLDWGFRESSLTRDEKTAEMKIIMCKAQSNQVEEHLKIFYYFHLVQLYKSASEAPEPIPCRPEALYSWLPGAKTSLNPFPWRLENPGSVFRLKYDFLPCSLSFPTCSYSPRPNTLPLPRHLSPHFSSRHSLGWYSSHVRSSEIAFTTLILSWLSFMAMAKLCLLANHILRKCWAP